MNGGDSVFQLFSVPTLLPCYCGYSEDPLSLAGCSCHGLVNQKALILEILMRLKHVLECLLLNNHITLSKDCNVALTVIIKLSFVLSILVLKIECFKSSSIHLHIFVPRIHHEEMSFYKLLPGLDH